MKHFRRLALGLGTVGLVGFGALGFMAYALQDYLHRGDLIFLAEALGLLVAAYLLGLVMHG